ncbi:hypothetical protein SAMN02982929_02449 [Saccharopolyspora kobensis]|uniref:Uncharacterized protein n=1 Tax=Saccharopolyspora kobensis TaxID=146035 RepID=A0A1H6ASH6_9PSEU|nr:hypothetical protein SAMN02982929_02449 [Saccharopolyspora kobensis]SFE76907.1 hypothetical protein SAMN05216506_11457 [Saccharopolyspora kobensis]
MFTRGGFLPSVDEGVIVDLVTDFLAWAWPRHLNPVSWYIRPLFFLPIACFCWTRRPLWLAATIVAMVSSFFWFPAPTEIDPRIAGVLEMEKELFTDPTWITWVTLPLIPALIAGLCAAFWHRSLGWGLVVIDGGLALKIAWTIANSGTDGLATVVPLGLGAVAMTAVIVVIAHRRGLRLALRS